MAKRSPILGYNHNVRYRGLIFHVQTEDSGLASPHLFTHLFYGGVIISTRKLVYDAGAAEDSIKGLMQAQHKVVMKDLKRGAFDDKIDQYLAGNPELLPRAADSVGVSEDGAKAGGRATGTDTHAVPVTDTHAVPVTDTHAAQAAAAAPPVAPPPAPAIEELEPPTLTDDAAASVAAAVAAANGAVVEADLAPGDTEALDLGLAPDEEVIPLQGGRPRRDTLASSTAEAVPGTIEAGRSEPIPLTQRRTGSGAAVPPPPPSAFARAGAPGSTPPARPEGGFVPDPHPERAGQYAQHKRVSGRIASVDVVKSDRPAGAPAPAAPPVIARTGTPSTPPISVPQRIPREPSSAGIPVPRAPTPSAPIAARAPTPAQPRPGSAPVRAPDASARPADRPRTPTPVRVSATSQPRPPQASGGSGGVVMTRPAVIVGAPAKPAAPPRVRKAREDEGRGFGQGLISEKSLDEVILAYLSEDAEDK